MPFEKQKALRTEHYNTNQRDVVWRLNMTTHTHVRARTLSHTHTHTHIHTHVRAHSHTQNDKVNTWKLMKLTQIDYTQCKSGVGVYIISICWQKMFTFDQIIMAFVHTRQKQRNNNYKPITHTHTHTHLSLIHIWRCRRITGCRSRWSPYH